MKQLGELKAELGQLRIQKVVSSGSKLNKMYVLSFLASLDASSRDRSRWLLIIHSHDFRKSIARVLTVINAKQRSQLRLFYKNKKYAPLDLRPKQTRAIRRRLSPEDKARVLEKAKKRETHFPQRKFAIKA
jgi:large subunit ribosomal protein L35e